MKKRTAAYLLAILQIISLTVSPAWTTQAYTEELVTNSGIVYPISLTTGKDAQDHLVFSDIGFFQYIKTEKFQTGSYTGYCFDLDEDGYLSKDECELVRVLTINGKNDITSVSGIEAFPKLRELYCSGSGITGLDLANNPRLQKLTCSDTKLTSLDVSSCPLLTDLKISGCQLTSLDLGANTALRSLTCMYQERDAYEYLENNQYKVSLMDWDKNMDLKKVKNVRIDGAAGDGINSGYDDLTGIIYCSDAMQQISYQYDFDFAGPKGDSVDTIMNVSLNLKTGLREAYDTTGGTKVLAQYMEKGMPDQAPEIPKKNGFRLTGWYQTPNCLPSDLWSFGTALTGNITLYAGWEKKNYHVHYDANGGQGSLAQRSGLTDWWTTDLIPASAEAPVRQGYQLTGWLTESGQKITTSNASSITYGQTVLTDDADSTILKAQWEAKKGYRICFQNVIPSSTGKNDKQSPLKQSDKTFSWESTACLPDDAEPILPGYDFAGWYTARSNGTKITEDTTYGEIYASQFKGDSTDNIPILYARFTRKAFTIYYDENGGSKVPDRKEILWDSSGLLPSKKTRRKNYIFAGWKCNGIKVTGKTKLSAISDGYDDSVTLKAQWYKKYEKKGTKFWRYGCQYKITRSSKKGNQVTLIKTKKNKKKITIQNKIFYNGRYFTLSKMKKSSLKHKKVTLKVSKKLLKKYRKLVSIATR